MTKKTKIPEDIRNELLKYCEFIATRYYRKHKVLFECDSVALKDLQQEAIIICLKLLKKYWKMEGKNNFDVKKFIGRAVGWKMRDMLMGAIVQRKNNLYIEDIFLADETGENASDNCKALQAEIFVNWKKDDFFDTLSDSLQYGFTVDEILRFFEGEELEVLKLFLERKQLKYIAKQLNYKNSRMVKNMWDRKIRPKLLIVLKKILDEYHCSSI